MTFINQKFLAILAMPERLLVFAILWFVFPFFVIGKFSYIYTADNLEIIVAHLISLGNMGLNLGSWAPHTTAGTDIASLGFNGILPRFMFTFLPGWLAYQIFIVAQITGAMLGSYLLCRRMFGLSKAACLIPPIVYGLLQLGQLYNSVFAFQPLLLYALAGLMDNPRRLLPWASAAVLTFWISSTAYISWLVPFPSILIILWFWFVDVRRRPIEWIIIGLIAVALPAMRATEILALAEIAPFTHIGLLRPLPELSEIIAMPMLIDGGLEKLLLVLFFVSWAVKKPRSKKMRNIGALLILGLFADSAGQLFQVYFSDWIPFLKGFSVVRIATIFKAILILSSAYSVAMLAENMRRTDFRRTLAGVAIGVIGIYFVYSAFEQKIGQTQDWISNGNYVHNIESPKLERLAKEIDKSPWPVRAEIFQIPSTYLQTYGIETASGYQALYLRRYFEFWSTVIEPTGDIEKKTSPILRSEKWPHYRSTRLYLTTYSHSPERRFSDIFRLNLLSMVNVGWVASRDKLVDPELKLTRGSDIPWSALSKWDKIKANIRANFFGRDVMYVYRNRSALLRFISPARVEVLGDGESVLRAMANADITELSETLFISKDDLPPALETDATYAPLIIKPVSYENDEIRLRIAAGSNGGILVGFNSWSPFWSVLIDGKPAHLFPANHAFWGVRIPSGNHDVIFRYSRTK